MKPELMGLAAILIVGAAVLQWAGNPAQGWQLLPTEAQCAADLTHEVYPAGTVAYRWCWPGPGQDGVFGCEELAGEYEHGDYHPCGEAEVILQETGAWALSDDPDVDCFGPETETAYSLVSGVRPGDPDYALAVRWDTKCPEWNLLTQ